MSEEPIEIRVDVARDPGGARLRALLEAQFAYERARRTRWRWLVATAAVWALPWLAPHSALVASAAIPAVRIVVLLRTAGAVAVEWLRQRRWSQALAQS